MNTVLLLWFQFLIRKHVVHQRSYAICSPITHTHLWFTNSWMPFSRFPKNDAASDFIWWRTSSRFWEMRAHTLCQSGRKKNHSKVREKQRATTVSTYLASLTGAEIISCILLLLLLLLLLCVCSRANGNRQEKSVRFLDNNNNSTHNDINNEKY